MTLNINWGAFQPVDVGGAFQKGYDQGQKRRVEALTGEAMNALLQDPNGAGEQIGKLAQIAPQNALALIQFQQKQQDRQRDVQFRGAQADYMSTFAPGARGGGSPAINALAPARPGVGALGAPGVGTVGADGGPPIGMAPPPPTDWQQNLGPAAVSALSSPGPNGVADNNMPVTPYMGGQPLQPIDPRADLGATPPAQQAGSSLVPVDPNKAAGADPYAQQGIGAESGVTGQHAPGETPMPPAIVKAAQSPNMEARNQAFMRMAKLDPLAAMKIDSEMRDNMLDRLEDADKAYRIAIARLPRVNDDAAYQAVLNDVDTLLAPFGQNIRETVPATYPGPEGIRDLLMKATDAQQQLAAMDRRFSDEARAADMQADNARQDRNTDSIIANRDARTDISRDRESRIASTPRGGGGGKKAGGPTVLKNGTVVEGKGQHAGKRFVYHNGELKPLRVSQ